MKHTAAHAYDHITITLNIQLFLWKTNLSLYQGTIGALLIIMMFTSEITRL